MIKKLLLFCSLYLLIFNVNQAFSAEQIKIMKDNVYLELSINPIKKEGRVLVPLSDIAKVFDTEISWEQETKTISYQNKEGVTHKLKVGSNEVETIKNNDIQVLKIDVAPTIYNNKVFVPVRYIAESFNVIAEWDSTYNIVYLGNCKKLGYYQEFPTVPSFSRISKTEPNKTNGMPQQMIYKHGLSNMKTEQALKLYLKLLENTGFVPIENEMYYNSFYTCADFNCDKKIESKKTLEGFSVIDKNNRIKIKVKTDVYSYIDVDYRTRTKTVYFGNSIIIVRVIDLNPPKFDEYWDVKTVPYSNLR